MDFNSTLPDYVGTNISQNTTSQVRTGNKYEYYMTALVLSWTNCVLIVGLNTAVIITILRYKKKSRLYFFLLNLAIADLLTGLLDSFPNSIERSIGLPYTQSLWVFGDVMCKLQRSVANMPMTASNYILAATSLDRAMVIYKPMMSFRRGHVLQKCVVIACWLFSLLVSTPYLKLMAVNPAWSAEGWSVCHMDWGDVDQAYKKYLWKVFVVVMFGYVFVIPLIIIVVSYAILLCSLHQRAVTSSKRLNNQSPCTGTRVFNQRLPKTKMKSIKLTFGIIVGFLVSWLVFFSVMFTTIFRDFYHPFVQIAVTFYYWSSVANPILFFIYHRRQPRRGATSTYSSDSGRNTCSTELHSSGKHHVIEK